MDKINAERAYCWQCLGCGEEHFFKVDFSNDIDNPNAEKHIRDYLELEEWQDIPEDHGLEVAKLPTEVICDSCGMAFAIYYDDAYYEDEDEDDNEDEYLDGDKLDDNILDTSYDITRQEDLLFEDDDNEFGEYEDES